MLADKVSRYVERHQALGFKYRTQSILLRNFAAYAEARGDGVVLTDRVLDWAGQAPSPVQQRHRLLTVRRFAIAMRLEDERYQIPPADAFGHTPFRRSLVYLYSPEDIAHLVGAAQQLRPRGSLRPLTYATLLSLLASTGLRVSEALALKVNDVTDDGLIIRHTKFRKSRLVPLHETARCGLEHYLRARAALAPRDGPLFVSLQGQALPYATVNAVFLKLARRIGLRQGPGHRGPRLHDLRHTFAVRSLEQCHDDHRAVSQHLHALSTYLGHTYVSSTFWYLQATPLLMTQIATAAEARYCEDTAS